MRVALMNQKIEVSYFAWTEFRESHVVEVVMSVTGYLAKHSFCFKLEMGSQKSKG